ncbi:MAG: 16S rRNA (guanine(527)-N(7))-methyltransferase RsmG [Vicinamibacterales bacterium]
MRVGGLGQRLQELIAEVAPVTDAQIDGFVRYVELLSTWNERINLTALPLGFPLPDTTLEKLIVEPLRATRWISGSASWGDLGSGGGSPAIPLKIVRPDTDLHLIESRGRKCAFLRTVLRELDAKSAHVHCGRFEQLTAVTATELPPWDVLTVRAVRLDSPLLDRIRLALRSRGRLVVFGAAPDAHPGFEVSEADDVVTVLTRSEQ